MVNCNPETVSTDYTMSDKLYFEPLNLEHVLSIIDKESLKGELLGVVVQLGGQTPLKLGAMLVKYGVKILGTSFESIDLCEDRGRFRYFVNKFNLRQTNSVICDNLSCVIDESKKIEFPILIRPSYVLGGHGMTIVKNKNELESYIENNSAQIYSSILVDHFLEDAMEIDVDAVSDGHDVVIVGIMEHIENAGVYSGDSSCIMPHYLLKDELVENIIQQTVLIGKEAKIIGLLNIQYAIKDNEIYVLEVNPRASRTIPFVSKVLGFSVVGAAVRVMLGQKISTMNIPSIKDIGFFAIKKPVFHSPVFLV
uniref:ATP-grasp domain-containing protein n=1 Tax=Biomphalaria glabrata TaxID=6526 RepID=A0A2C9JPL3_BIOGL